jgi:predicted XRE-type DNA-binding protein
MEVIVTEKIIKSSGNVFADLGVKNPEEALAKAELILQINKIFKQKRLTQKKAAEILGIDQPKVSALLNGKLSGFSTDRLLRFLNALGRDVDIIIKFRPRSKSHGHIRVMEEPARIHARG